MIQFNIIQEEEKLKNNLNFENIEIPNFNNIMPNLKENNDIYTQWKNEFNQNIINERKTFFLIMLFIIFYFF